MKELGERLSLLITINAIFGAAILLTLIFVLFRLAALDEQIESTSRFVVRKIKDRIDDSEA